jgi:formamidopyrimidine-DNA glycosylase
VPELPEVEVVRRDLEAHVVGARIADVVVTGPRSVRRQAVSELRARVRGREVATAGRRGKYLVLGLADRTRLVVHLRMSGQLLLVPDAAVPRKPHTHVVFALGDGRELRFVDPRTFGEVFAVPEGEPVPALDVLGPEPFGLRPVDLHALLRSRRAALKPLLMDQRFLAGLGNIYSDEVLWTARLRWDRRSDTVSAEGARRLHSAVQAVLADAVTHRGSSLGEDEYVDLFGRPGRFQLRHQVYGRAGLPCLRCGTAIQRIRVAGRSSYLCTTCQRRARRMPGRCT